MAFSTHPCTPALQKSTFGPSTCNGRPGPPRRNNDLRPRLVFTSCRCHWPSRPWERCVLFKLFWKRKSATGIESHRERHPTSRNNSTHPDFKLNRRGGVDCSPLGNACQIDSTSSYSIVEPVPRFPSPCSMITPIRIVRRVSPPRLAPSDESPSSSVRNTLRKRPVFGRISIRLGATTRGGTRYLLPTLLSYQPSIRVPGSTALATF
ncbi:hypothetical protein N657DRAFT_126940 [Parathielavia appendiculata]|uniref:Uncharacterized protein n=1 Tax=Parathielavia appendiculata TaxID=2587402 RepID=A0AAN6TV76_9PEZI|nr:hypothetical protein N657DRAFT_126940 [Parathielavia appendiculata]